MHDWEDLRRAEHWDKQPPSAAQTPVEPWDVVTPDEGGSPPPWPRLWSTVARIAMGCAGLCWLTILGTFIPGAFSGDATPALLLLLPVAPLHTLAMIVMLRDRGSWFSPLRAFRAWRYLSARVIAGGVVAALAAWLTAMLTVASTPRHHATAPIIEVRLVAAVAAFFYSMHTLYFLAAKAMARSARR